MPKRRQERIVFGRRGRRVIEADFSGGDLSSDGGLLLLRQVDEHLGLIRAAASSRACGRSSRPCHWGFQARHGGGSHHVFSRGTDTITVSAHAVERGDPAVGSDINGTLHLWDEGVRPTGGDA
jgi:hypothetical protein